MYPCKVLRKKKNPIRQQAMAGKVLWNLAILALVSQCLGLPISSTEHKSSWSAWTLEHNKTYDASEVRCKRGSFFQARLRAGEMDDSRISKSI